MKLCVLRKFSALLATACLLASCLTTTANAAKPVDFSRDIKPILSNTCFKCHGFDEKERQAELRLDTPDGATRELPSGGRAIVPGKSAESTIIARLTTSNPDERMPPAAANKTVTPEQIELIKQWIDQGAEYRGHWSFIAPQAATPPAVGHASLVRNPIDQFILARLEAEGLEPSPPADKVTLLRRVTLDLTGLPPTLAEVDAFLADNSVDAYERVVERLLASPRYGEHFGRYWLDQARYGDTHGLHLDNERSLWPYRDWVIAAFNRNLPFNQFTIEQLAGDLLPGSTLEQQIATGFNRCNVSTSEGGSIDEEVLVRYAVDRVETTSTVWMGLTAGCAVCHDHKFDPITQREFYQLYAFFNGVAEKAMDGNIATPPPIIQTPKPEHTAKQQELQAAVGNVNQQIAAELAKVQYIEPLGAGLVSDERHEFVWIDDALPAGAKPSPDDGGWQWVSQLDRPVFSGTQATIRQAEGLKQHYFTEASSPLMVGAGDTLFAYVFIDPKNPPKAVMLQFNDGTWEHRAVWGEDVIPFGTTGSASKQVLGPLPEQGKWVRLEVEASKVGFQSGAKISGWAFTQHDGTVLWDKAGIVTRSPQAGQLWSSLAAWEAAHRGHSATEIPGPVKDAIKVEASTRTPEQVATIRNYFFEYANTGTKAIFDPLHQQKADLEKQVAELDKAIPRTLVMADMPQPRETFMLIRGAYDKKGDKVTTGVPAALPPLPSGAPQNRLGLAQWLVDPSHPLTARVAVNRYWQQYFGTGIVKTSEDFGSQGEWPSHPELLDWLAIEFVQSGWDVKHMQRMIVTSNTYRQSSHVTPQLIERDPENRLLARGPRFRVDAEVVRDCALATSGLLVEQLGGPSVKPYQPSGLWEAIGFVGSNTSNFKQDQGDSLYRRSMYTFWKRTCPPPSLLTFDAPSRETCTVRRPRTNTPLQALVLMNDEQYVEAARKLAERMITEGGSSPQERAGYAFRLATARAPAADELAVLVRAFESQLADYRADADAATKLISIGQSPRNLSLDPSELAAWTMVANLILNLDETVTKE